MKRYSSKNIESTAIKKILQDIWEEIEICKYQHNSDSLTDQVWKVKYIDRKIETIKLQSLW